MAGTQQTVTARVDSSLPMVSILPKVSASPARPMSHQGLLTCQQEQRPRDRRQPPLSGDSHPLSRSPPTPSWKGASISFLTPSLSHSQPSGLPLQQPSILPSLSFPFFQLLRSFLSLKPSTLENSHPEMRETQVPSLGREDHMEKEMATHSSILAWRIPWTEEPAGL